MMSNIMDRHIEDILKNIKVRICGYCQNNVEDKEIFYMLPCLCVFCSKKCYDEYFKLVFSYKERPFKCNIYICL
jgi:hypothetical protein